MLLCFAYTSFQRATNLADQILKLLEALSRQVVLTSLLASNIGCSSILRNL
jgi:hypothetical protein